MSQDPREEELLKMIRQHKDPQFALLTAIQIITDFLNAQPEQSSKGA